MSSLKERITTVPYVKPKGQPKHSGILWPSKKKQPKKSKRPCDESTANVLAAKKARLSSDVPGSCAYRSMVLREQKRKTLHESNSDVVVIDITAGENDNSVNQSKGVVEMVGI